MKKLNSLLPSRAIAAAIALSAALAAGLAWGGDFKVRATGVCKPDWRGNFITNDFAGAETRFCAYAVDEETYQQLDGDYLGIYQAWLDDEFENSMNKVGKDASQGQGRRLSGGGSILATIGDVLDADTYYVIFVLTCSSGSGNRDYYIAKAVSKEYTESEAESFLDFIIDLIIDPATDKWHYIGEDAAAKATLLFGF